MAAKREWRHVMRFYDDEQFLVDALVPFVTDSLEDGAAAVIIATPPHLRGLEERLVALGVDVAAARAEGRYIGVDAAQTLATVMDGGAPSESRFIDVIGGAVANAGAGGRPVHAFGETVGLLATAGQYQAALRVEQMWNLLGARQPFTLFCGYPMSVFGTAAHADALASLCAEHSQVIPTETYLTLSTPDDQLRSVAFLQQRAQALEHEIGERKGIEARLEHHLGTLQVLYRLADTMGRASDLGSTCDAAVEAIRTALAADRASILILDDQGVMRFKAWRQLSDRYRATVEGHSPWSADAVDPTPVLVPDAIGAEALQELSEVIASEGIRSLAFIPILCRGRLLGKFMVYYDRPHHYSHEEVNLATTIARHVGFGVERARAEVAISDLLERERAARGEAEVARVAAEAASRAKDEFLAMLSHELRTPLTAIFGWVKMLRSSRLDGATTARALEVIDRNVANQAQLISDLLDVSRIITGKMVLNVGPVDLVQVIGIVIDSMRPAADAKGITLRPVLDSIGPVLGDADRLQQVVWNLLSNAVKFTPDGGRIEVELSTVNHAVRITVSDTGKGISPEFLPYLFDRFRQADGGITRRYGGLGLGLAIVRHLVELHGGTVQAASAGPGLGARFTVELPARGASRAAALPAAPATATGATEEVDANALAGLRVVVVDDNADTCDMLTTMLAQQGAKAAVATAARDALALLAKETPDVLLCDIAMPGMDGYHLIRQARARSGETGRRFRAIAVTAYARPEDRDKALAAGFDGHITKPVDPAELIALIADVVRRSPSAPQSPFAA